ncbi:hypothetical protein J6590_017348 [Homalodisca vitripennis]|nr:hypothetical protein J6590_017348 [Homalodisca vitripennis]
MTGSGYRRMGAPRCRTPRTFWSPTLYRESRLQTPSVLPRRLGAARHLGPFTFSIILPQSTPL